MPKRTDRARQSRLNFSPLPSSSPAVAGYHPQIQDRAAAVGYEGASSGRRKRQKIAASDGEGDDTIKVAAKHGDIPAKFTVSPIPDQPDDVIVDDEPGPSTQRRSARKRRALQGTLDFGSHTGTSAPESSFDWGSPTLTVAPTGLFSNTRKRRRQLVSSDDETESSERRDLGKGSNSRLKSGSKPKVKDTNEGASTRTRSAVKPSLLEGLDENDDTVLVTPVKRKAPPLIKLDGQESDDDDDDVDDIPTTQGKRKRQPRKRPPKDDFIDDDSFPELDHTTASDSDVQIVASSRKRAKGKAKMSENDDDDDDDHVDEDDIPRSSRRRISRPSRRLTQQEQDDIDEDLEFLNPSSDAESSARLSRSTQSAQKIAKQAALERLKQKRSGLTQSTPTIIEDEQMDGEEAEGDFDDDDVEDDDLGSDNEPFRPPPSTRAMFEADEDDEDFLEDDSDGALGVNDDIPIEFTRYGSMKPKELFKNAIEWMVQRKLNPAFEMEDQLYNLTFRKLDDEVRGLAGSKFTSAAWTPDFTRALKARPDINIQSLDGVAGEASFRDKCDACNRTSHPATFQIQLTGAPYIPGSLAEIDESDSTDESEDDDDTSEMKTSSAKASQLERDYQGFEIPPESTVYYVGRFCKSNAQTAHTLHHWKYHLNEWVITWLIRQGYDNQKAIAKREKMGQKKRRKHANKVADLMEEGGVIKDLWRRFKDSVSEARVNNIYGSRFEANDY